MNKLFYPKLALNNIRKNGRFYFPYLLTCLFTIAMFYIMCLISFDAGLAKMPGSAAVTSIMGLGTVVVGIFAAIFLFYTNSFLIKRRQKELGLYNILGMEKRHIAKILYYETIITGLVTLFLGLLLGILMSKLIFLLLYKMLHFAVPMGFSIDKFSVLITLILFICIFFLTLLKNLMHIKLSNPIELLKGSNVGEREPKTKWLLTLFGLLTLSGGYYIALTTESPLDAIFLFFIAVILVIIGTYCLFSAGSIALLKGLRKKPDYYYTAKHFTSISGMIYRMKQNAVGLANICILSTMVLVLVSTTVSLYVGVEDQLENRYPNDISIILQNPAPAETASVVAAVEKEVTSQGLTYRNDTVFTSLTFGARRKGDAFITESEDYMTSDGSSELQFITNEEYAKISGNHVDLAENEVLLYSKNDFVQDQFTIFDQQYQIVEHLSSYPTGADYVMLFTNFYYVVVADRAALEQIYQAQLAVYAGNASSINSYYSFDLSGTNEEKIACSDTLQELLNKPISLVDLDGNILSEEAVIPEVFLESRQSNANEFYVIYGGFLFIGLFLGILFLMATVLIIYYKQISEGYDDKERFEIMQKVGMSRHEIKTSIRSQIVTIFFLPIAAAIIHIAAAFKMILKLLSLFNLTDTALFITCTGLSILVFGIIYAGVFVLTAKSYYRIVS
ncbi:MAG: FtsX-like permease family protein [Mobilitalea sp.]